MNLGFPFTGVGSLGGWYASSGGPIPSIVHRRFLCGGDVNSSCFGLGSVLVLDLDLDLHLVLVLVLVLVWVCHR